MTTTPPSPPVAPEPAQETWSQPELDEVEREATAMHAALGNAELAQENQASSSEAAGDVVTHEEAREAIGRMRLVETADHVAAESVRRYIDQQEANGNALHYWSTRARELEQSLQTERAYKNGAKAKQEQAEREAAALREQVEGYRTAWSEACGEREKAMLAAEVAETEAEIRRLALVAANGDCDAERAQKEALRVERDKLLAVWNWAWESEYRGYWCRSDLQRELSHLPNPPQPAPAAPVAKEEATAEAWVRCHWVSREGEGRCIKHDGHESWKEPHVYCGRPCPLPGDYCPECGVNGTKPPAEPAPQPHATTGEPLLGPVDALRAEIVAALRVVMRLNWDASQSFDRIADELERRKL